MTEDEKKMEELKEQMQNQKALKLKDYLRLSSLSQKNIMEKKERKIHREIEKRNSHASHTLSLDTPLSNAGSSPAKPLFIKS